MLVFARYFLCHFSSHSVIFRHYDSKMKGRLSKNDIYRYLKQIHADNRMLCFDSNLSNQIKNQTKAKQIDQKEIRSSHTNPPPQSLWLHHSRRLIISISTCCFSVCLCLVSGLFSNRFCLFRTFSFRFVSFYHQLCFQRTWLFH